MRSDKYYDLAKNKLYDICRSITGKGLLKTLKLIKSEFPDLTIRRIKSGTKIFDWKVPPEWEIKEAYVLDKDKKKIIDFKENNLHILNYSRNIHKEIKKEHLLNKIYSAKHLPKAIPYLTSYYKRDWGFCTTDVFREKIKKIYKKNDKFLINIDSKFKSDGNLYYGELFIKGHSSKEILISTYVCHPSMANNELSGPILSMALIDYYRKKKLNYSLRFIFIPETIGSIGFLCKNLKKLKKNTIAGYLLSCVGDEKMYSCIFSKNENSISDISLRKAYKKLNIKYKKYSFLDGGSDERQFNSPGIDLPIASIYRSKFGTYKEYHTSLDNFDLVTKKGISQSFNLVKLAINQIQKIKIPKATFLCEPFLFKRKLYPSIKTKELNKELKQMLDFLKYSDGSLDLIQILNKIKVNLNQGNKIYKKLLKYNLIN